MSLAQLHYTSTVTSGAKDGGAEGRFTAADASIPGPVRAEAAALLRYETPAGAPGHPATGGLLSPPVAFSFSALADGSHLLSRTVASGAGGFHAHAVHLPAGTALPGRALPVDAWGAAGWLSSTPDRTVPSPLSTPADGPAPSHGFPRDGLGDFAVSRGPWLATVLGDLRRASEDASAPAVVLVERYSADVARWVALACAALPREYAERLTFTTYTRRPGAVPYRVLGVLPQDAPADGDARFRVHRIAGPAPAGPVDDAWARAAARIWRGRAPELFARAAGLPGEPFAAGPLAVTALGAGIALGSGERAAAADWAARRPYALDDAGMRLLTDALTAPGEHRTPAECAAAHRLLTALDGRSPASVTAPLAALLVTEAVRGGDTALEPPARSAFAGDPGREAVAALVTELGDDLLAGLAAGTAGGVPRTVQLLRLARLLDLDCEHLLPGVVRRLALALRADPEAGACPALTELLDEQFDVRTSLLGELDALAPDDPAGTERLLARVDLPFTGTQSLPHLRMCVAAPAAKARSAGRTAALHTVLRAAGVSPFAEPLVLRTAVGLVWAGETPTPGEGRALLDGATSDAHRAAGTWRRLVDAALTAPVGDEDGPALAHDLLRGFPRELDEGTRTGLLLLDFARGMRSGDTGPGWTDRVRALREGAGPPASRALEHAYDALARRLLEPDRPEAELYAFVHSDDPELADAYDAAARGDDVRSRLRTDPAYTADCFTVWSAHPHAGPAWARTRTGLLDEVLRPAVRSLPPDGVAEVERYVREQGTSRTLDAFRAWNRPSRSLGGLGRRIAGRVRRG
ncbi:hypothetical protein CP967_05635 [Streptomyces nitrosporeus]|uniref:Uncharacterized protein n=1 Tax=Streptomyces nitrosporeus TaxID=28894 RepID=A0A5J6F6A4_9ACTN|nr:GTPase-associated protein 1-related protein [Streptomyces nitrosporeus]QEU71513.1 hypothetical protein CP967_05635 [Streptomyces nitrosporeus]GGZ11026.1 hypothetical protein GCM10010327_47120 [Streptomyces nitrosporeus]